jgi:uncharacterized RDD family membrane protein YckC
VIRTLPDEVRASQGHRAGLVSRTAAGLIDLVVAVTILAAGYLVVASASFVMRPRTFRWPSLGLAGLILALGAVVVVYLSAGWSTTGRTAGAQVMGLRVVGRDDHVLRGGRACIRAMACVLLPVGLLWCAVDRRARALHDVLLGTSVIYDWRRRTPESIERPRGGSRLVETGAAS